MTWKEIEKLHHKECHGNYGRSESSTYDIIEAVNKLIDSHNTDSKSEREILLNELIDEIEQRRKYMLDIATASMTTRDVHNTNTSNMGYNSALVEVQELIRKKM